MTHKPIILASTSAYKAQQLKTLGVNFTTANSNITEYHNADIPAAELAITLSTQKAQIISAAEPDRWVIGSDQTAITSDHTLLTKPGTQPSAIEQLLKSQGKSATFFSAVCLMKNKKQINWAIKTRVKFRNLTLNEITRYVEKDQPEQCAGSFKVESLGISLFDYVNSNDPTALIGLPLLSLARELRKIGFKIP